MIIRACDSPNQRRPFPTNWTESHSPFRCDWKSVLDCIHTRRDEMLQEQLDALLSDGEAASQQQQVSTRVVLGNKLQRAAASLSPPPPSWTDWRQLCRPWPAYRAHVTAHWRLWRSLCVKRFLFQRVLVMAGCGVPRE